MPGHYDKFDKKVKSAKGQPPKKKIKILLEAAQIYPKGVWYNGGSNVDSVEATSHHVRSSLRGTHEITAWNGAVVLEYYNDCKTKVSWCWVHKNYQVKLNMKKLALALAASIASAPAMAGVYVNVESNASYTGNDYTSRTTDLHVGYEGEVNDLGYYVQGGPALVNGDAVDGSTDFSGKGGVTIAASEKLDLYGEVSFITDEDTDNVYGTKLGVKYNF